MKQKEIEIPGKNKVYENIYILKAVAAILILFVHANPEFSFNHSFELNTFYGIYGFVTLRFAITALAFFFSVSGFLTGTRLVQKEKPDRYLFKLVWKVIVLCVTWSLIALTTEFLTELLIWGNTFSVAIDNVVSHLSKYSIYYSVLGFGNHLWYLNALVFILVGFIIIRKLKLVKPMIVVSFLLLCVAVINTNTNILQFEIITRDAVFYGMFYFLFGYYLSSKELKPFGKRDIYVLIVGSVLLIIEGLIYNKLFNINYGEIYISSTIFIYPLIKLGKSKSLVKPNGWLLKIGKFSDRIYYIHYIIISVLFDAAIVLGLKEKMYNTPTAIIFAVMVFIVSYYYSYYSRKIFK